MFFGQLPLLPNETMNKITFSSSSIDYKLEAFDSDGWHSPEEGMAINIIHYMKLDRQGIIPAGLLSIGSSNPGQTRVHVANKASNSAYFVNHWYNFRSSASDGMNLYNLGCYVSTNGNGTSYGHINDGSEAPQESYSYPAIEILISE